MGIFLVEVVDVVFFCTESNIALVEESNCQGFHVGDEDPLPDVEL